MPSPNAGDVGPLTLTASSSGRPRGLRALIGRNASRSGTIGHTGSSTSTLKKNGSKDQDEVVGPSPVASRVMSRVTATSRKSRRKAAAAAAAAEPEETPPLPPVAKISAAPKSSKRSARERRSMPVGAGIDKADASSIFRNKSGTLLSNSSLSSSQDKSSTTASPPVILEGSLEERKEEDEEEEDVVKPRHSWNDVEDVMEGKAQEEKEEEKAAETQKDDNDGFELVEKEEATPLRAVGARRDPRTKFVKTSVRREGESLRDYWERREREAQAMGMAPPLQTPPTMKIRERSPVTRVTTLDKFSSPPRPSPPRVKTTVMPDEHKERTNAQNRGRTREPREATTAVAAALAYQEPPKQKRCPTPPPPEVMELGASGGPSPILTTGIGRRFANKRRGASPSPEPSRSQSPPSEMAVAEEPEEPEEVPPRPPEESAEGSPSTRRSRRAPPMPHPSSLNAKTTRRTEDAIAASRRRRAALVGSPSRRVLPKDQTEEKTDDERSPSPATPIDLHKDVSSASWIRLYQNLEVLQSKSHLVAPSLSSPSRDALRSTPLHTMVWKGPPPLALMMIRLLAALPCKTAQEVLAVRDSDNNTALHLCCASLEDPLHDDQSQVKRLPPPPPLVYSEEGEAEAAAAASSTLGAVGTTVLEALVQMAPQTLEFQNREGDTPLQLLVTSTLARASSAEHCPQAGRPRRLPAAEKRASAAALQALQIVLQSPLGLQACVMQDCTGATPLHSALALGVHEALLERLLEAEPGACRLEDDRGMLPLHYLAAACYGRAPSAELVQKVVEAHPEALVAGTRNGDTPLHLVISNATSNHAEFASLGRPSVPTAAMNVIDPSPTPTAVTSPRILRTASGDSEASASSAVSVSCSLQDANFFRVLDLFMGDAQGVVPTAAETSGETDENDGTVSPLLATNREKLTPLHCCALFEAPPPITRHLMKHPIAHRAASMSNNFGATPLHLAVAQPSVARSIATVVAIGTPEAAAVQDRMKRTPLHIAAQNVHATERLIGTLAQLHPEGAQAKTQRGHLPLHLAAQSQARESVVRALLRAYPEGAQARNKSDNLPLHDAAKYRASAVVVQTLLEAHPPAVFVQNQYGNLPLHCATAYQAHFHVVQLLLEAWPEAALMQNRNQDTALHFAAAHAVSREAVRPLLEAAPSSVLLLNSSGQSPLDRAKANNAPQRIMELLEAAVQDGEGWGDFDDQNLDAPQEEGGGEGGASLHEEEGGGDGSGSLDVAQQVGDDDDKQGDKDDER